MLEFHMVQSARTFTITIHSRCVSWHGDRHLGTKDLRSQAKYAHGLRTSKPTMAGKTPRAEAHISAGPAVRPLPYQSPGKQGRTLG